MQKVNAELAIIGDNVPCDGLETMVCNVDKLVLVVPAGHPLAAQGEAALAKVFDFDFVTLARSASLTRKVTAAALRLAVVDIVGMDMGRVLLVSMRRRAELSSAAAALVDLLENTEAAGDGQDRLRGASCRA